GRGRGQPGGRGGRGNNRLPYQELTIPLIGDWTTVNYRSQMAGGSNSSGNTPPVPKKEDIPSSSKSNKIISYKDMATNDATLEQTLEYFENPISGVKRLCWPLW
ncbi:hypothetical protein A2U01_0027779, partial [Trifolium medium]|nr:hypothetical protein [Trifolium medium]